MTEKKYTIWINYGMEGWQPEKHMDMGEVVEFIKSGGIYGEIRITTEVHLTIN